MTADERSTAYRAAAAKLGEALAKGSPPDHVAMGEALTILGLLSNQTWLTEAARLRLLVEAALLEQGEREERVGSGYRDCLRDDGSCAGCGAPHGALHEGVCDWERCGKCQDQRMACGCDGEEIEVIVREWAKGVAP